MSTTSDDETSTSSASSATDSEHSQNNSSSSGNSRDSRHDSNDSSDDDDGDNYYEHKNYKTREQESDAESSSDDDDDDDDDDASIHESTDHLPLGERLEREAKYGIRRMDQKKKRTSNNNNVERKTNPKDNKSTSKAKQKKSKHAPTEASSKRSDFFATLRQTQIGGVGTGIDLGAHRYQPKDPRVNNLHGHLQEDHFHQNYSFVQELRKEEMNKLQRNIHAWKTPGRKGQQLRRKLGLTNSTNSSLQKDQERLKELRQEMASWERQEIERVAQRTVKQKLKDQAATTGKYYFPKRRELRQMQDDAKMEELRKRKGETAVEKVLAKRRKKNKSKDAGLWGAK